MVIFFFYLYDEEAGTTVPVPVDDKDIENDEELEFFFDDKVRKVWHKQEEEWYFSVTDVCQVLTDSADGRKYWNKLKQRLKERCCDRRRRHRRQCQEGARRKTRAQCDFSFKRFRSACA